MQDHVAQLRNGLREFIDARVAAQNTRMLKPRLLKLGVDLRHLDLKLARIQLKPRGVALLLVLRLGQLQL